MLHSTSSSNSIISKGEDADPQLELSEQAPNDSDEEGIQNSTLTKNYSSSTSETEDASPEFLISLHQPMPTAPPGRPCLKRNTSESPVRAANSGGTPSSSSNPYSGSGRRSASEGSRAYYGYNSDYSSRGGNGSGSDSNHQEEEGSDSSRHPYHCSFAAPRRFSQKKTTVQQVRFESSPQAYLTHSSTNYDRTPIKCTKGSELDMSMPPRCSKEEEISDEECADNEEEEEELDSDRIRLDYFGRWANLKKGTIIGGLNEEDQRCSTSKSETSSSNQSTSSPNACELPFRGVRSFGGLCSKPTLPEEAPSPRQRASTPPQQQQAAFEEDATPMPSPSVRRSHPFVQFSDDNRSGQLPSSQSQSISYFDLARNEADLDGVNGGGSESGAETVKEESTTDLQSPDGEPIRMRFVRVSRDYFQQGNEDEEEEMGYRRNPSPSQTLLSACDLDWTLVSSSPASSSRNGSFSTNQDRSPIPSSRSSRSNSQIESEPLSASACSEIEAVREMLKRHQLEARVSARLGGNGQDASTSPPLSPFGSDTSATLDGQKGISTIFSQVDLPATPADEPLSSSSSSSPPTNKLCMVLTSTQHSDSTDESTISSPISFVQSSTSSSFSSLTSSPMSSRSSSLEGWMVPIPSNLVSIALSRDPNCSSHNASHVQAFLNLSDPGLTSSSSCNTSTNGSLSDDTTGTDSPPTHWLSSNATSPEFLPVDHHRNQEFKAKTHLLEDEHDMDRLGSPASSPYLEGRSQSKTRSSSGEDKPRKKSSLSTKSKARKEKEKQRERARVRELLGEDGDCLGGF